MEVFKLAKAKAIEPLEYCHTCYQDSEKLIQKPCLCLGSVGYTHHSCLQQEVISSIRNYSRRLKYQNKRWFLQCSICKHPIEFSIQHNKKNMNQIPAFLITLILLLLFVGLQILTVVKTGKLIVELLYIVKFQQLTQPSELCEGYPQELIPWLIKQLAICSRLTIILIPHIPLLILLLLVGLYFNPKFVYIYIILTKTMKRKIKFMEHKP